MSQCRRDGGFTLIETMVVVGLVSLLSAFGVGAWRSWTIAQAQQGAATDLQTILRQTQVRAVTEGISFCVKFNAAAGTYTVYRYACAPTGNVKVSGPYTLGDARLHLTGVSFNGIAPATTAEVTFRSSGSATPGGLSITRTGSTKTYSLDVEGLTGRVSLT
jgi:prepilin-type N-terminal cleavage/methylation domain-containing protein